MRARWWRRFLAVGLTAICGGGLWASGGTPAQAASWTTSRVLTGLTGVSVAQVDGQRVLFTAGTSQARSVYLFEIGAGVARRLNERPFADPLGGTPQMDTGRVVYAAATDGQHYNVYLYDLLTSSTKRLTNDTKGNTTPCISGDYVAYKSGGSDAAAINLYRISTGKALSVVVKDIVWKDVSHLSLDGGYLTWQADLSTDPTAPDSDVFVCDIAKQRTTRIHSDLLDGLAQVRAGRVVWQNSDPAGTTSSVRMFEPAIAGQSTTLSGDEGFAFLETGAPGTFMDDAHVAWLSRPAGGSGGLVRLHGFTDGLDKVLGSTAFCRNPQVGGTVMAWTGSLDGADWGDVFAYDLASDQTAELTSVSAGDRPTTDTEGGPVIVAGSGNVAWTGTGRESLFLASSSPSPPTGQPFADVSGSQPYQSAIDGLFWAGIVSGHRVAGGARYFDAGDPVNRAQFAKMIVGTLGVPLEPEGVRTPFTDLGADVPDDAYPHEYVATVWTNGVTQGLTSSTYGPWRSVKRAQVVTMLVRAAQHLNPGILAAIPLGYTGSIPTYDSPDHATNLKIAEFNGLLAGLQGFGPAWDPDAAASRGEVAQLMWNYLQALER